MGISDDKLMKNITIRVVENGYLVYPFGAPYIDETYVFGTFEALVEWLKDRFGE